MAMTGLFSGVDPELIRQQEAEKRQGNNLALAQSSNPFASTMFTGLNLADELRNKTADVFGNPIADSPAVAAAKEEKLLEEEVARMVMEGRKAGKQNSEIAAEVQAFLQGKGKFNKAEQMRTNLITEEQTAAKNAAEIEAKKATALKDTAQAGAKEKQVAALKAALKKRFPKMDDEVADGVARDENAFRDYMTGKEVATGDGIYMVRPDGSKEYIGKAIDRSTNVEVNQGDKAMLKTFGENVITAERVAQQGAMFVNSLQQTKRELAVAVEGAGKFSGDIGNAQQYIAQNLEAVGLLPPGSYKEKLTNTKTFKAKLAQLLLDKTGGKIGAGFSNTDLDTVKSAIGQVETNPEALFKILDSLEATTREAVKRAAAEAKRSARIASSGVYEEPDYSVPPVMAPQAPPKAPVPQGKPGGAAERIMQNPQLAAEFEEYRRKKQQGAQ